MRTVSVVAIAWAAAGLLSAQGPKAGIAAGTKKMNPKDGLTYVWIPPVKFQMGCSPGDAGCGDVIPFRRGQNCVDRPICGAGPRLTLVGASSKFSRHDFRGELIAAFRERGNQANCRLARLIPLGVAFQIPHRRGFDGREQA